MSGEEEAEKKLPVLHAPPRVHVLLQLGVLRIIGGKDEEYFSGAGHNLFHGERASFLCAGHARVKFEQRRRDLELKSYGGSLASS